MSAPILSLCMIVRDSARTLAACLDSIRPWVDELIVVDTGSADDTRQIARVRGAQVFEFPWIDDFAAARNESLRHARGKWIFWMDSDDTIDQANGRGLREVALGLHDENTQGYVVQVHCPSDPTNFTEVTVVDHVKLIRNDLRIRFEGRIHEQVLPSIRRMCGEVGWTDLFVVHSGADQTPEGRLLKQERDLRILEMDLKERPNHPFVLFNLGMTHEDMGQLATAENWLRKCLARSDPGESHVRKAFALLVSCLERSGRLEEAQEVCKRGLDLFEDDEELRFRLGLLEHRAGNRSAAIAAYRDLLSNGHHVRRFTSIDRGISTFKARHNLALVHADCGDQASAELQWRYVLESHSEFAPARRGLGQSLLSQEKLATLDVLLDQLRGRPNAQADIHWLQGLLAERRSEFDQVRMWLERALALDERHLPARQELCRWLSHHGTLKEAEFALRELVARSPEKGAALHNLGLVLGQQGRVEEAIAALEQSLLWRPTAEATRHELNRLRALRSQDEQHRHEVSTIGETLNGQSAGANVLPHCYARREIPSDSQHFHCLHPLVHSPNQMVDAVICGMCTRWREPQPENLRPESDLIDPNRGLSCQFIGPEIGRRLCPTCAGNVQVKVFSCNHSNHIETTLVDCRSCSDFNLSPTATASNSILPCR